MEILNQSVAFSICVFDQSLVGSHEEGGPQEEIGASKPRSQPQSSWAWWQKREWTSSERKLLMENIQDGNLEGRGGERDHCKCGPWEIRGMAPRSGEQLYKEKCFWQNEEEEVRVGEGIR